MITNQAHELKMIMLNAGFAYGRLYDFTVYTEKKNGEFGKAYVRNLSKPIEKDSAKHKLLVELGADVHYLFDESKYPIISY